MIAQPAGPSLTKGWALTSCSNHLNMIAVPNSTGSLLRTVLHMQPIGCFDRSASRRPAIRQEEIVDCFRLFFVFCFFFYVQLH